MANSKALNTLLGALRARRLHHAILLYGSSVQSLEEVAKGVAQRLLGSDPDKHPDMFTLRPEGKMRQIKIGSEADKIAGDWPPNTMRALLSKIMQSSNRGGAKVAVVYDADRMNAVAANAFLKTLEEPPSDTTIFMLTTRPNDLLDTIRSRCVSLRVEASAEPFADEQWQAWIEDFKKWQRDLMSGVGAGAKTSAGDAVLRAYGLLSRFNEILARLTSETAVAPNEADDVDEEIIEAAIAGEKRALVKRLFTDMEDACVSCALGGNGVPAVKISRAVETLEKTSGLLELNMAESQALEFFMLSSLRIWGR